jgi:hypothetical protein
VLPRPLALNGKPVRRQVEGDQLIAGAGWGIFVGILESERWRAGNLMPLASRVHAGEKAFRIPDDLEPVSGVEPLTCRLQDGCSAN